VNCDRFVKQEEWERWRAKRTLVSGSKPRMAFDRAGSGKGSGWRRPALRPAGGQGYHPREIFEILYAKPWNLVHF